MNNTTFNYELINRDNLYNNKIIYYLIIILILLFSIGFSLFINLYCYGICCDCKKNNRHSFSRI